MGSAAKIIAVSSALVLCVAVVALLVSQGGETKTDELLSPLEVGMYAVRAERQSEDYDRKAVRQIAFATDNDNAATSERELAAKEEKRARESAYLAADVKSRIDKILEAGRDQVNQATKLKTKAGVLQQEGEGLLDKAKVAKDDAAKLKEDYYKSMDKYNLAVKDIDDATKNAQSILDQMNAQSLVLAQVATQYAAATEHGANPDAKAAQVLKAQLQEAQKDLAEISTQKTKADADAVEARKLADKYQPVIIAAEASKRASDLKFQDFAHDTHEADELQNRADALLTRAGTIDDLIDTTQEELAEKRKEFEHYKNRAQTEMAISLQAEDKEAALRKEAREAREKAAALSDKARALRSLAQKGVNNVMESIQDPASAP